MLSFSDTLYHSEAGHRHVRIQPHGNDVLSLAADEEFANYSFWFMATLDPRTQQRLKQDDQMATV